MTNSIPIKRAVSYILCGAALNFIVGWSIAWSSSPSFTARIGVTDAITQLDQEGHGWTIRHQQINSGLVEYVVRKDAQADLRLLMQENPRMLNNLQYIPAWSRAHSRPTEVDIASEFTHLEAVMGWPFKSLYCDYAQIGQDLNSGRVSNAVMIKNQIGSSYPKLMPLGIRPLSFILNSLIYSAFLHAVWSVVMMSVRCSRAIVDRKRTRLNLCVKCAYPVKDFVACPECGQPVPE